MGLAQDTIPEDLFLQRSNLVPFFLFFFFFFFSVCAMYAYDHMSDAKYWIPARPKGFETTAG